MNELNSWVDPYGVMTVVDLWRQKFTDEELKELGIYEDLLATDKTLKEDTLEERKRHGYTD